MNRFIKTIILFSIPFIIWITLVYFVDPFNFYGVNEAKPEHSSKYDISYQINNRLFKLIQFSKCDKHNIIIGDSRAHALKEDEILKITGVQIKNMALGGSHFGEMKEVFWHLVKNYKISEVYFGISFFNLCAIGDDGSRIKEAERIAKNPISYSFNVHVYRALKSYFSYLVTGKKMQLGKFKESKEEVWKRQLSLADYVFSRHLIYTNYQGDIDSIASYCADNNIKLVFFVPPTHTDLQEKINNAGLASENEQFLHYLSKYILYDFNYPNYMTTQIDNFKDPYHFTDEVGKIIIKELFHNENFGLSKRNHAK